MPRTKISLTRALRTFPFHTHAMMPKSSQTMQLGLPSREVSKASALELEAGSGANRGQNATKEQRAAHELHNSQNRHGR
jgi:hypothetical protein